MISKLILYGFIIFKLRCRVASICPEIVTDVPRFSKEMMVGILTNLDSRQEIHCCMYGVSNILWAFNNKTSANPADLGMEIILTQGNRTLIIINCNLKDTGLYKCIGINGEDQVLNGETYLQVASKTSDYGIKIIDSSSINSHDYELGSDVDLFCTATMFMGTFPYFTWNRVITNKALHSIILNGNLTIRSNYSALIDGYQGFSLVKQSQLSNGLIKYNLTISIKSITNWHHGQYNCVIQETAKVTLHNNERRLFQIYIIKDKYIPMWILLGILTCILAMVFVAYHFKYDTKIFIKSALRTLIFKNQSNGKYNFFFIYNFHDDHEFRIIQRVVADIEGQGFSSYFHHRDQTYGKDTIEDLRTNLKDSDLIVIWASTNLWKQPDCCFCINALVSQLYSSKRVYILNEKRKTLLQHCNSKAAIADLSSCFTSKLFVFNPKTALSEKKSMFRHRWNYHQFIKWLISSLPIQYSYPRQHIRHSDARE